jgi:hypothetical protein
VPKAINSNLAGRGTVKVQLTIQLIYSTEQGSQGQLEPYRV